MKWWNPRTWPHPEKGNYCGYSQRCKSRETCPKPEDKPDSVCLKHDGDTSILGDWKFTARMLMINPFNNKNYAEGLFGQSYGRAYQYGSAGTMFIIGLGTVPYRGMKKLWNSIQTRFF